jgi:hypothetical protein
VRYHLERGRYCGLSYVSPGQGIMNWRSSEGDDNFGGGDNHESEEMAGCGFEAHSCGKQC